MTGAATITPKWYEKQRVLNRAGNSGWRRKCRDAQYWYQGQVAMEGKEGGASGGGSRGSGCGKLAHAEWDGWQSLSRISRIMSQDISSKKAC